MKSREMNERKSAHLVIVRWELRLNQRQELGYFLDEDEIASLDQGGIVKSSGTQLGDHGTARFNAGRDDVASHRFHQFGQGYRRAIAEDRYLEC